MIHRLQAEKKLQDLDAEHSGDGDGGYSFVEGIRAWISEFDGSDRSEIYDFLFEVISEKRRLLWGVALETLVQENPPGLAMRCRKLFALRAGDQELGDQLVLAILRLRFKPFASEAAIYIQNALGLNRRTVLPALAALAGVDKNMCVQIASTYFARELNDVSSIEVYRGYFTSFVRIFLSVDSSLFRQLIEATRRIDRIAGDCIACFFDEILSRRYMAEEFGESLIEELRRQFDVA